MQIVSFPVQIWYVVHQGIYVYMINYLIQIVISDELNDKFWVSSTKFNHIQYYKCDHIDFLNFYIN